MTVITACPTGQWAISHDTRNGRVRESVMRGFFSCLVLAVLALVILGAVDMRHGTSSTAGFNLAGSLTGVQDRGNVGLRH